MRSRIPLPLILAAATVVAAAPASANVPFSKLLSHTPSGDRPNAPATEATISGDGRQARYAAFTSEATDIAGGSAVRKVFLVKRKRPFGNSGSRWREQRTVLVTKRANGDSWSPSLDGFDDAHRTFAPRCLAFVSKASNLVGHDPNGKTADVYVYHPRGGRLQRVRGTGGATEVVLDGRCQHLAYVKGGRPYVSDEDGGNARSAGGRGARDLDLSGIRATVVYERHSAVWVSKPGRSARRLAAGDNPAIEGPARTVAFDRGGKIFKGRIDGRLNAHRVAGRSGSAMPNLTIFATFVAYAVGARIYINAYSSPKGDCTPDGSAPDAEPPSAREPQMSGYGNYLVYTCTRGPAWLTYVGDRATGNPR